MAWWDRIDEARARWMLAPLVGVGPLRFGMDPDEVEAALGVKDPGGGQVARSGSWWTHYGDQGLTLTYRPGMLLAAVAIEAMSGPQVIFEGVELIGLPPSAVRSDLKALAQEQGVTLGANLGGDTEVAAWGVSMGASQEWELTAERYLRRTDRMLSQALFVAPELATDPYSHDMIVHWRDIHEEPGNPGHWPVTALADRPVWEWTPLTHIGPLRFGMGPQQVSDALGGEQPAVRRGHEPYYWYRKAGQWSLEADRFDTAGVTAHYWYRTGLPTLAAVTVHGRTGPQIGFDGLDLIGQTVTRLDDALIQRAEDGTMNLMIGCGGDLGPADLGMYVRAERVGDSVVSAARFCTEDWEDHG